MGFWQRHEQFAASTLPERSQNGLGEKLIVWTVVIVAISVTMAWVGTLIWFAGYLTGVW